MKEVLVICPSRGRPKMLGEMIESFSKNSKISSLIIALDDDDVIPAETLSMIEGIDHGWEFGPQISTTERINKVFNEYPGYEYYSISNDDFIYHTDGWDIMLTDEIKKHGKIGIAYGNDLLQGKQMPTTSVISREIVAALGWLQLPTLTHLYGDSVWQSIGRAVGCLYYRPDVIIEHRHYFSKKVPKDETFMRTNSPEMYNRDDKAFKEWIKNQAISDIEKVKNLMIGEV